MSIIILLMVAVCEWQRQRRHRDDRSGVQAEVNGSVNATSYYVGGSADGLARGRIDHRTKLSIGTDRPGPLT